MTLGIGNTVTIDGSGTNQVTANGGFNLITAGAGADTLIASGQNNEVIAGAGQTTIDNGSAAATGPSNELTFLPGIATDQLWFLQSGNDLRIDVMGTEDEVTIANWFGSVGNTLNDIATSDGSQIDSQISQLVQAMATFETNNPGFDPTAAGNSVVPNDPTLQTALAAAWHH